MKKNELNKEEKLLKEITKKNLEIKKLKEKISYLSQSEDVTVEAERNKDMYMMRLHTEIQELKNKIVYLNNTLNTQNNHIIRSLLESISDIFTHIESNNQSEINSSKQLEYLLSKLRLALTTQDLKVVTPQLGQVYNTSKENANDVIFTNKAELHNQIVSIERVGIFDVSTQEYILFPQVVVYKYREDYQNPSYLSQHYSLWKELTKPYRLILLAVTIFFLTYFSIQLNEFYRFPSFPTNFVNSYLILITFEGIIYLFQTLQHKKIRYIDLFCLALIPSNLLTIIFLLIFKRSFATYVWIWPLVVAIIYLVIRTLILIKKTSIFRWLKLFKVVPDYFKIVFKHYNIITIILVTILINTVGIIIINSGISTWLFEQHLTYKIINYIILGGSLGLLILYFIKNYHFKEIDHFDFFLIVYNNVTLFLLIILIAISFNIIQFIIVHILLIIGIAMQVIRLLHVMRGDLNGKNNS